MNVRSVSNPFTTSGKRFKPDIAVVPRCFNEILNAAFRDYALIRVLVTRKHCIDPVPLENGFQLRSQIEIGSVKFPAENRG